MYVTFIASLRKTTGWKSIKFETEANYDESKTKFETNGPSEGHFNE